MQYTNKLKLINLLILFSFISTSFCLSQYIENCTYKNLSCCCENSDEDISRFLDSNEKCCCEIKEVTNTQLEISLNSNERSSNLQSSFIRYFYDFDINNNISFIPKEFQNTHSPPGYIYILNSNFRI